MGSIYRDLESLWNAGTALSLSDAQLLERFATRRDAGAEAAIQALISRHGPLVWRVCRQILTRPHDAEDAFQATFLILVRRAGTIQVSDSLAPWLYRVAYRVAVRSRSLVNKQRHLGSMANATATTAPRPDEDLFEIRRVLHEEVNHLPDRYRLPIVLFHLEGKTLEESASILRCPVGTVTGRLSRARQLLRSRLTRRGLGGALGVVEAALVPEARAVPAHGLIEYTSRAAWNFAAARGAACGGVSLSVSQLAQRVLSTMMMTKIKVAALIVMTLGLAAGLGMSVLAGKNVAEPQNAEQQDLQRLVKEQPRAKGSGPMAARSRERASVLAQVLTSPSLAVAFGEDGERLWALSYEQEGKWRPYRIPDGVKVLPIVSSDSVAALAVQGQRITQVAAFSSKTGQWAVQELREPARERLWPNVGSDMVYCQVGHDIYAFSGLTGTWGDLHLPGTEPAKITYAVANALIAQQGKTLYIFSKQLGRWSDGVQVQTLAQPWMKDFMKTMSPLQLQPPVSEIPGPRTRVPSLPSESLK
jgi:RNA polymerase sigma factor (sigma-70 family)